MGNLLDKFTELLTMSEQPKKDVSEEDISEISSETRQELHVLSAATCSGQGDNCEQDIECQAGGACKAVVLASKSSTVSKLKRLSDNGQNAGPHGKQRCQRKDLSCDHQRIRLDSGAGDASTSSSVHKKHSSLNRETCSVNYLACAGNINDLPHSVLLKIFGYLTMKELLQTAMLVCKCWHCLTHDPDLWRSVSLKGFPRVNDEIVKYLTSLSDNMAAVDLTDANMTTADGIIDMLQRCTRLKNLKLVR